MEKTIKFNGLYVITPAVDSGNFSTREGTQKGAHDTDQAGDQVESHRLNLLHDVEFAIVGGARIVQYRDKSQNSAMRLAQAKEMLELCKRYGVLLIINDDVELAAAINAHGVHLGGEDASLQTARKRLGSHAIIGASCYNRLELAIHAQEQAADYVAFGRFFPSSTKPNAVQADVELLRLAKRQLSIPIVAIGGITAQNGAQLVSAGADMLAVVEAVFAQDDIISAARQFAQCFS